MKALVTALMIGVLSPLTVMAANPLTPAEQPVCRSLNHCLEIVKTHPHDSFDYAVLAAEFARFGQKGYDALIRMIAKSHKKAGNAADLLAVSQDYSSIKKLNYVVETAPLVGAKLAKRTVEAIRANLDSVNPLAASKNGSTETYDPKRCLDRMPSYLQSRKSEMPFFELNVATPSAGGAYRPSAQYRLPLTYASRGWLRTALPIENGWVAGYPDGLVFYDNQTGQPDILFRGCVKSLQSHLNERRSQEVWAKITVQNGTTNMVMIDEKSGQIVQIMGPLLDAELSHQLDRCSVQEIGLVITQRPNGTPSATCSRNPTP
ncbi:hypothetical protein [Algimonas arctica]|nr:hypothetical protein [Algimonas arctica]